ncbi:MAG TPA: PAS domain S-box protein [Acidobacteriota bacterium]|nr:PAS domain S-box protein [Acidobacteriota bacterium]
MAKRTGKAHVPAGKSGSGSGKVSLPSGPVLFVGIGASAGGLKPINTFLSQLKPGCGLAVILVQHHGHGGDALLATLGQQKTPLRVAEASEGTPVEGDHVYVLPARGGLSVINGKFSTQEVAQCHGLRMRIDHFFCTLAADQGRRSVGIVLSGTGSDGTGGLAEIKAAGGTTIAQDPNSAEFPEMPSNAIAAGHADIVLRPDKMVSFLNDRLIELSRLMAEREGQTGLEAVLLAVRSGTGHDFHCYRKATLERRARRRMALHQLESYDDYAHMIRTNKEEAAALRKDLLIGVTEFFRQAEAWNVLERKVVTGLIQKAQPGSTLRIWVPACSTGKEAYSVAMLMMESIERTGKKLALQIFATDADASAVEVARSASYAEGDLKGLSQERLGRFCVRRSGRYEIVKELRKVIVFAPQDLLADPPFSKLDLITCRNLLIYLDQAVQKKIVQLFHFTLLDGGYIFLGSAETISGQDNLFEPISQKWRIYRKLGVATPGSLDLPLRPQNKSVATVPPVVPRTRLTLSSITYQAIAERFGPAAAVVDRHGALLYTHGNVRDFLELPLGETTGLLADAAREGLRNRLTGALAQAVAENRWIVVQARVRKGRKSVPVKLTVSPMRHPREADGLLLVTFEPIRLPKSVPATAEGESSRSDHRRLEDELKIMREELSSTIDQLEQSNEHLKASNEEVTASNEELQSTNEELETSKEELQSLNEELNAVNQRLQEKVVELEQASNDVSNLLTSGGIATVFLDKDLRIRRFTQAALNLLSLVEADMGRPIADIHRKFRDDALLSDARRVLLNLAPSSAEVEAEDGNWYVRRILPYRTNDDRIEGVVITFNDVTDLKRLADALRASEASVRQSEERFRLLVDGVQDYAIFMVDPDGRVASWNHGAQRVKGWTAEEIIGQSFVRFYPPETVAAGHPQRSLERAAAQGSCEEEGWRIRKDGSKFWANVTITALHDDRGKLRGFSKITRDITERKQAEEALREARDKAAWLARFPEENPNPVLRASADGTVLYRNQPAGSLPGWACEVGKPVPEPLLPLIRRAMGQSTLLEEDAELGGRSYSVSVTPFIGESYANLYGRDVTERKRAEEALRRSEEKYRRLFENMGEGFALYELLYDDHGQPADWIVLEVNDAYTRHTGISRERIVGRRVSESFPGAIPEYLARFSQVVATQTPMEFDTYARATGRYQHVVSFPAGGRRFANTIEDITERKRSEGALREAKEQLELRVRERTVELTEALQALRRTGAYTRSLIEASLDPLVTIGPDGNITDVNAATEAATGRPRQELIGTDFSAYFTEPEMARAGYQRVFQEGLVRDYPLEIRHRDGRTIPVLYNAALYLDESGRAVGVFAAARDITDRKQAEGALHESELRYRTLFDRMDQGFCVVEMIHDSEGKPIDYRFVEINPTFEEQSGLRNALGKTIRELVPQLDAHWFEIYGRVAQTGEASRFEAAAAALQRIYDVFAFPIGGAENPKVGILFKDITDRKRTEAALREAYETLERRVAERTAELARSNEDLEQFAHVAGHDLQEPLRMVNGFLKLLEERYGPQLDDKAREYIGYSVEGATRMSQLITDLLAYSRVDRKGKELQPTDAGKALANALANLRGRIQEAGAKVTNDELPTVKGDSSQLSQLFQNLIGNAIKFRLPDRPCLVHVGAASDGGRWLFSVRDNGIGIPEEAYDRVFVIFQRLHTRKQYGGTGIGLAICKKIVERHGGRIWIESKVGEGSTFHFTIPGERTA